MQHLAPFALPAHSVWVWALALYDFCYYWLHRAGHEVNILWAAHVVHHQSEHYNLSTALRQTASGMLPGWRPADAAARFPKPGFDLRRERFDPPMTGALTIYCLALLLALWSAVSAAALGWRTGVSAVAA